MRSLTDTLFFSLTVGPGMVVDGQKRCLLSQRD